MFVWYDPDQPIGNRLWFAFVFAFFILFLLRPPWLAYLAHPLENALPLLLVLGYILVLDFGLNAAFFFLVILAEAIGQKIDRRNRNDLFVEIEAHPSPKGCVLPFASASLFAAAVILAPGLGLPWWMAVIGWASFLMLELFGLTAKVSIRVCRFVTLEAWEDWERISISLQTGSKIVSTTFEIDWQGAVGYLADNEWELFQTHQEDVKRGRKRIWKRTALFRKYYHITPFFGDWHGQVENYLLGAGSRRHIEN